MKTLRNRMIDATIAHAKGKISLHKANVEVYLQNPAGIGEHSDVMEGFWNTRFKASRRIPRYLGGCLLDCS